MTLVRWNPMGLTSPREFTRIHEDMDRLIDSVFGRGSNRGELGTLFAPPVDVTETPEEFVVRADLPGIALKDVKVQLMGETLTLRGERRQDGSEKDGGLIRNERVYGSFERTFDLGAPVRSDQVKATYKDGVLEVRVPKAEQARVREIEIRSE
jgi:HSP20 family protein